MSYEESTSPQLHVTTSETDGGDGGNGGEEGGWGWLIDLAIKLGLTTILAVGLAWVVGRVIKR